ncbi:Cdc7p-Dbf4p kinase complex regulatory subunit [Tilletia horrida]|nr:Cdc7p-Dbf4p kinase complex regulatory subunit [Tilletia horrida]
MERRPLADKANTPQGARYVDLDSPGATPTKPQLALPTTPKLPPQRPGKSNALVKTDVTAAALTLTPKKRAIPRDEIHARNFVLTAGPVSPSPKRARVGGRTPTSTSLQHNAEAPSRSLVAGTSGLSHGITSHDKLARGAQPGKSRLALPTGRTAQPSAASLSNARTKPASKATASVVTTTRIDKTSRISEQERLLRHQQQQDEANVWRAKFRRAFPSFVFYLDSYDTSTRIQIQKAVESLGARVEPFFSNQVTHLVTTRNVPSLPIAPAEAEAEQKKQLAAATEVEKALKSKSPLLDSAAATVAAARADVKPWAGLPQTIEAARRAKKHANMQSPKPSLGKRQADTPKSVPIHSDRNPFDEPGPLPAPNDIVYKAKGFGMKVWHHSKLTTILNMLLGDQSTTVNQAAKEDLGALLEREKVEGTTERDPNAPRADYYYFPTKVVHYLLVEDATGEHRPIMIQEYEKPKDTQSAERPPWPRIYGELEGRCPFTYYDLNKHAGRVEKKPTAEKTLRRALSMNQIGGGTSHELGTSGLAGHGGIFGDAGRGYHYAESTFQNRGQESGTVAPYQLASGNSVTITSNVASTAQGSTTSLGPGSFGTPVGQGHGIGAGLGISGSTMFPHGTSALAHLSRRIQTVGTPTDRHIVGTGSQPLVGSGLARTSPFAPESPVVAAPTPGAEGVSQENESGKCSGTTPDVATADQSQSAGPSARSGSLPASLPAATERGAMGPPMLPNERRTASHRGPADSATPPLPQHGAFVGGAPARAGWPPAAGPSGPGFAGHDAVRRVNAGAMGSIRRSVSVNEGLRVRAHAQAAGAVPVPTKTKEKEKKPGYCENCRTKFEDIEEHVLTKKHQRFAANPDNFTEIDQIILKCHGIGR